MVLRFPNWKVLLVAIDQIIPASVIDSEIECATSGDGSMVVHPTRELSNSTLNKLKKLGVATEVSSGEFNTRRFSNWQAAIPLVPHRSSGLALIEMKSAAELPRWMAQLRRHGIPNIGWAMDSKRAWLRVNQLPESLTIAAESEPSIAIYWEQSVGVWSPWNFRYPGIRLPRHDGVILILKQSEDWESVEAPRFKALADRFEIRDQGFKSDQSNEQPSVTVRPRLKPDRRREPAEMWLVDESALTDWLKHADDQTIARFDAARIRFGDQLLVAMWPRRGRGTAAVLVIEGVAYRSYQKLSNLFVPAALTLEPSLRRDLARRTYASNAETITWLKLDKDLATSFSVPSQVFQPLSASVNYQKPPASEIAPKNTREPVEYSNYLAKELPAGEMAKSLSPNASIGWTSEEWQIRLDIVALP